VKSLSVRAVAVTAVLWLAVVGSTAGVEAASNGNDTRAAAAKPAQVHQPDTKRGDSRTNQQSANKHDEPKVQSDKKADDKKQGDGKSGLSDTKQGQTISWQSDKKPEGAKTGLSDKAPEGARAGLSDKKLEGAKTGPSDKTPEGPKVERSEKKQDQATSWQSDKKPADVGSDQVSVETARPDAGPAPSTWSKSDQSVTYDSAKEDDNAPKPEQQRIRPTAVDVKSARSDGDDQKKHVQVQGNDKTSGKSGSNPDSGGVDKPYPAAGQDAKSQGKNDYDGNNGCGNDSDRADDNNGNCGKQGKSKTIGETDKPKHDYTDDHGGKQVYDDHSKKDGYGDHSNKHDYPSDYVQGGEADAKGGKDHTCYVEVDGKTHTRDNWHEDKDEHSYKDTNEHRPKPHPYKDVDDDLPYRGDHSPSASPPPIAAPVVEQPAPVVVQQPVPVIVEQAAPALAEQPGAVIATPVPTTTTVVQNTPPDSVAASVHVTVPTTFWGPDLLANVELAPSAPASRPAVEVIPTMVDAFAVEAVAAVPSSTTPPTYQNLAIAVMPATGGAPIVPLATVLAALGGLGLALRRFGKS
jgi:hypothetical protein